MAILTDTNIFVRLLQPGHPHCLIAERAVATLRTRQEILTVAPQNLVELWTVATRPILSNGLGLTPQQAGQELDRIRCFWVMLPELPLFSVWEQIVRGYGVSGKGTHDARLVAAIRIHRIAGILTFNVKDFDRYSSITVLEPVSLA